MVDRRPRRSERDLARARSASERVTAAGGSAMEAALAAIDAAFNRAAVHNRFKQRVETLLALGPAHPEVKARFCERARRVMELRLDLAAAIAMIEDALREERRLFYFCRALTLNRPRLPLMALAEAHLLLRFLRRKGMDRQFTKVLETLCEPVPHLALAAE
jgi:hypothetical protein